LSFFGSKAPINPKGLPLVRAEAAQPEETISAETSTTEFGGALLSAAEPWPQHGGRSCHPDKSHVAFAPQPEQAG
jgi:hypothetical protein